MVFYVSLVTQLKKFGEPLIKKIFANKSKKLVQNTNYLSIVLIGRIILHFSTILHLFVPFQSPGELSLGCPGNEACIKWSTKEKLKLSQCLKIKKKVAKKLLMFF